MALVKVIHCLAVRTAAVSAGGAHTQPTFQPVTVKVLAAEEIVTVRSRMPGRPASGTWVPS